MTDLLHILPYAVISCVLTAGVLAWLLVVFRDRPRRAMAVLVTVPIVGALGFVVFISGFMFTPQLGWTLITCVLIAVTVVPMALVLGHQITGRALRREQERAAERAREHSHRELIAWVGHDLRTPLGVIRAMGEALEDGVVSEPDDVREYGGGITEESGRLADMIDDLFELSRVTSGQLDLCIEPVPTGDLVSASVDTLSTAASGQGVAMIATVTDDWPVVSASRRELDRVVRNLLTNAIRHTTAGGSVRVTGGRTDGRGWLAIEDGCGGIPEAELPRLFDAAFRGDSARSRQPGAELSPRAGLGLTIVRGLVHAQHGRVSVRNTAGGCRFEVQLPLTPAAQQ